MKKNIFIVFFIVFTIIYLFTQTAEEKLLSKKEKMLLSYQYQATHGNRIIKLQVLEKLEEGLNTNQFSVEDKEVLNIAVYLTQEGTARKEYDNNVLINNYPDVRMKACKILAKIKNDQARTALIEIIKVDTNHAVLAEACNALAEIGDNANGDVLRAIIYLYRTTYAPPQNLVFAIVNAIKMVAKSTTKTYGDAISVLQEIMMGPYNEKVRTSALEALQYLRES